MALSQLRAMQPSALDAGYTGTSWRPRTTATSKKHSDVTVTTQPSEELHNKVVGAFTRTWRYQRSRPSSAEPARPPSRRRRAAQPACGGKVQRSAQALMLGHWLRSTCVGAAAAGRRRGGDGLRQPCRGPRSGPSGAHPLPAPVSTQSTLPSWLGHRRLQPSTAQQLAACPPAPAPKASSRSTPMGHSLRTLAATAHPNAQPRLHPHAPPPTEGRKAGM